MKLSDAHKMGLKEHELRKIIGPHMREFKEWMSGQTMMMDTDGQMVFFSDDVSAFMRYLTTNFDRQKSPL